MTVTLKDGTVLTPASDKIEFTIPNLVFIVYVDNGPKNRSSGFVINDSGHNILSRQLDIGHAGWEVNISPAAQLAQFPQELRTEANQPWGFNSPGIDNAILAVARTKPVQFTASATGQLNGSRLSGNAVGHFEMTSNQTEAALQYTHKTRTSPPDYVVPTRNCVDVCVGAINSAGGTVEGNIRTVFRLKYYPPNSTKNFGWIEWKLNLSDPHKLAKSFKNSQ